MYYYLYPLTKKEDAEAYKKLAEAGTMLAHGVTVKGKTHRPDNNLPYHSTIKVFDSSRDHPHEIHNAAKELKLNPPNPKTTGISPETFKDRFGNDVHVLVLSGNDAHRIKEHNQRFSHMGYPATFDYKPHVSLDKETWQAIKDSGAKTAHEAGLEFGHAKLYQGHNVLATYRHPMIDNTPEEQHDPIVPLDTGKDHKKLAASENFKNDLSKSATSNAIHSYAEYRNALKKADASRHCPEHFAQHYTLAKSEKPNKIRDIADSYAASKGLTLNHDIPSHNIHPEHAANIANAYAQMKHDPNHPDVKRAYDALTNETVDQLKHIRNNGLKISRIQPGQENPYKGGSKDLANDVNTNNHMWYYPTETAFGSGEQANDHPLLAPTSETHDGKPLLANDAFRIVHDYFGHAKEGHTFGPKGEDNAWKHHMQMYSPEAQKALTSETRGQNSWVNYGPLGEQNRKNPANTTYAEQKAGLLPAWTQEIKDAPAKAPVAHTEKGLDKLAASEKNELCDLHKGEKSNPIPAPNKDTYKELDLHHGTKAKEDFNHFDMKHHQSGFYPGVYTSSKPEDTEKHGRHVKVGFKGHVFEINSPKHAEELHQAVGGGGSGHKLVQKLKDAGYHAIKRGSEHIIFDPKHAEIKKSEEPLEKGAIKNAVTGAAMLGASLAHSPAPASQSMAPVSHKTTAHAPTQSSYDHNRMLRAIAQVESSGGKNTNHEALANGTHAFGKYGLTSPLVQETIRLNPELRAKHSKALALQGDTVNRYLADNPGLEDKIASRHLARLEHHFGNDPATLGVSWLDGITGTNKAKAKGMDFSKHWHGAKVQDAYKKGGI